MVIICGDLSNSLPYNKIKYYTYSSYSWYSWLVYSGWSVVPNNWMSNCVLSEVPLLVVTREKITVTRPQHYICYTGAGLVTTPPVRGDSICHLNWVIRCPPSSLLMRNFKAVCWFLILIKYSNNRIRKRWNFLSSEKYPRFNMFSDDNL